MGRRGLTGVDEQRRCAAVLWSRQVDAAALVGADGMRDGGGGCSIAVVKRYVGPPGRVSLWWNGLVVEFWQ